MTARKQPDPAAAWRALPDFERDFVPRLLRLHIKRHLYSPAINRAFRAAIAVLRAAAARGRK